MKLFIIILFGIHLYMDNCSEYNEKNIKPIVISGTLNKKQIVENGKSYILTIKKDDNTTFDVILLYSSSTKHIYDFIQINDRIEKDKSSLLIRIGHFFSGGVEVKRILIECN